MSVKHEVTSIKEIRKREAKEASAESAVSVAGLMFVHMAQKEEFDETTIAEHAELFLEWQSGFTCDAGTIVQDEGKLYKAIKDVGVGQAHYKPSETLSVWRPIADPGEEWPAWSRPIDALDAYDIGAKVTHNGIRWICTLGDGAGKNSWEPGVYGWTEVTT